MFTPADDQGLGIPVVNESYPDGEAGIQKSLAFICKKIREGAPTAIMKSFAGNVLREAGFPQATRDRAIAMLHKVLAVSDYAHDVLGTEQIQSAAVTLCVNGAPVCIPIRDCDDGVVALGTLLAAAGMEVEVVRQIFGANAQQHVLVEVKLEDGTWFPLDPSSRTMMPGTKARAQRETRCSPWDEAATGLSGDAQFVGIGALPVFLYGQEGWRQVEDGHEETLGAEIDRWHPVGLGVEAPLPAGKVVLWEGGWWYRDPSNGRAYQWTAAKPIEPRVGIGAPLDLTALNAISLDPRAALRQFWKQVDLRGRSWDQATVEATSRATSGNWIAGDLDSRADFITLLIHSALNAKLISERDSTSADALNRTWVVIAERMGIRPSDVNVKQMQTTAAVEAPAIAPIIIIAAIIMSGVVVISVIVALLYFSTKVVDDVLSKIVCERELLRLHAEYNKVVDKQLGGGQLTDADRALQSKLEEQQKFVAGGCAKPKQEPSVWPYAVGAGIVGATILGVVYAPEIKGWLAKMKR